MIKLKKFLLYSAVAAMAGTACVRAATVRIDQDITTDTTWAATDTYILDTTIYVRNGATLTIEAGTVVKGSTTVTISRDGIPNNVSALWVTRGSKLIADGTRENPITFTFEEDNVNSIYDVAIDTSGMWGGVVLCGYGQLNSAKLVEGGAAIPIYDRFEGTTTDGVDGAHLFGGDNDADNSGILRYVSIRYAGNVFAPNSELNSLTLAAVGSGTTISYVEAFNGSDDGFEWWGGVVNTDHLVAAFCEDDDFDTDQGYRGVNQFWFGIKPPWNGSSDSRGMESDGDLDQNVTGELPISKWTAHNVTLIGRGLADTAFGGGAAWNARDETSPNVYNMVVTDFSKGLKLDDDGMLYFTNSAATAEMRSSIFNVQDVLHSGTNGDFLFSDIAYNNTQEDPLIGGVSYAQDLGLNPRPQAGSPALSGVDTQGPGLVTTTYRGAFGRNDNWADGWTALSQMAVMLEATPTGAAPMIVHGRSGQTLQLTVQTESGKTYQLQSTSDLGGHPIVWTNEGAAVTGNGGTQSFDQTVGASGDKYFQIKLD